MLKLHWNLQRAGEPKCHKNEVVWVAESVR